MLSLLQIENIAVIERSEIEFGPGLNVLTGETGAGKSIIIDAISALLGARTSRELIRSGAANASVTAVFTDSNARIWLEDNGIDPDDDIIINRKIATDGKNTCRVNGVPVTVSQLKELGVYLVDIHGQNDGQNLLDEAFHRRYLDSFACAELKLEKYSALYAKYRDTLAEIDSLMLDEKEKEHKVELLKYRISELSSAEIKVGEEEALISRRSVLRHVEKLISLTDDAYERIYGNENSEGAAALIADASNSLKEAARINEEFSEVSELLVNLRYIADDAAERLREARKSLDYTPGELEEIESRLSLLQRLMRKYGGGESDLLKLLESSQKELESIEYSEERISQLQKKLNEQKSEVYSSAGALSKIRKDEAKRLESRIMEELSQLSMPGVRFEVRFTEKEPDATGCDDIRFLMSANAGEELGRISRIASGGELSRIMLAMKNVLSERGEVDTMIFDEVDSGVSGIAAQRVGEKLSDLAGKKQVLCVTHLSQLASIADRHYSIEKSTRDGRTYTTVSLLDEEGRKAEIARLIGGDNITITTLNSAAEMISSARLYKKKGVMI